MDEEPRDEKPTERWTPDEQPTIRGLRAGQRVFDRYTLEAEIGRGGMGVVWRACDEELDRAVALKFLPEAVALDPEAIRDLKRETRRCLELTHPNIVRVHDFAQDERSAAIAMELIEGESLAKRKTAAPGGCLSAAELAPWVQQLCAALEYAHGRARVVHRDLKPANLLLNRQGELKVTDFGVARSLTETRTRLTNQTGGTSGTLLYMSPQQFAGDAPTASDDIYALGATLYELLTGKAPFYRGDSLSLMTQIRERTPAALAAHRAEAECEGPEIPARWSDVILACLAKDPKDRPQSAGEVQRRLEGSAVAEKKARVAAVKVAKEESRPNAVATKRRGEWPAATAAAAVGLAGLTYWLWPHDAAKPDPVKSAPPAQRVAQTEEPPPAAVAVVARPREFSVNVDPPEAGAHLWLGPVSDVSVPVDGRAVVKDLPDGEHELVVQAAGYQPLTTRVTVKDGRGTAEAKLVPVRGALRIAGRPGTVVSAVDARGRATQLGMVPASGTLVVDNLLTIGAYTVKFAHSDLAPTELPAELAVGRTIALEPPQQPLPGELRVFSVPTDAEVTVNGNKLGATPATLAKQPSEVPLSVEVFARGYRRAAQTVTLKPREVRTLNLGTLVAESGGMEFRFSNLEARGTRPEVKVDGKPVDTARTVEGLEVGRHTVEVGHADYAAWRQEVAVRDQQVVTVEVKLAPKPGRLAIRANPAEIVLKVDGRAVHGDEVVDGALRLAAGEAHTLEARAKGYKAAARTLTLTANQAETWEIVLEKQTYPQAGEAWENTLGMKFVPVPGTEVLFCVWDVRVQDYEGFARATQRTWPKPEFQQGPTHPAVNVSWEDAKAFCVWLTAKERGEGRLGSDQEYRLPMDWEWSVAVGLDEPRDGTPQSKDAKTKGVYPWGTQWPPLRGAGNYGSSLQVDEYPNTSAVGRFAANRFGLYDMGGNVWQWCEDYHNGSGGARVLRGASFNLYVPDYLLSSNRGFSGPDYRYGFFGFRVVVVVVASARVEQSPGATGAHTRLAGSPMNGISGETAANSHVAGTPDRLPDFARAGPGLSGWRVEKSLTPGHVVYTWNRYKIEFVQISPGAPVYLATTEMPVGLFVDWTRERKLRSAVEASLRDLMKEYTNRLLDTRLGPTTYIKGAGLDFEVSQHWIQHQAVDYYLPDGKFVPAPTALTPVNYVAPGTAKVWCESLHCRIPTSDEWRAARATAGTAQRGNRRDQAWLKYWKRVNEDLRPENLRYWPDDDIFLPMAGEGVPRNKSAKPAVDQDDGVLWFSDVTVDEQLFHHLVGNVAEYVTVEATIAVIGGSALSPRELDVDQPYPVDETNTRGFSDVGFRLAFSVEETRTRAP